LYLCRAGCIGQDARLHAHVLGQEDPGMVVFTRKKAQQLCRSSSPTEALRIAVMLNDKYEYLSFVPQATTDVLADQA
jgi:hypothetical protein